MPLQILSLCCDGMFNNYSEIIMQQHHISQDQYQSSIYTIAFIFVLIGNISMGKFIICFTNVFLRDGTIAEIEGNISVDDAKNAIYTRNIKFLVLFLFTFTGLLGSSCAGAITKQFGALRMSVTSTTRKATTLFISLAAPGFKNKCTSEHILGMFIFISALFVKSFNKNKTHTVFETATSRNRKGFVRVPQTYIEARTYG
jgi:hypothetical protein